MIKLSKDQKKVFFIILAAIVTVIISSISDCLCKKNVSADTKSIGNEINDTSKVSPSKIHIELQQNNSNVPPSDIQPRFPQNAKQPKSEITIDKIDNRNGNFSAGQSGGTVNQTINVITPPSRHLNKDQATEILSSIPNGYTVEIRFPYPDQESGYFSEQIERLLSNAGRKPYRKMSSDIDPASSESFKIEPYPNRTDMMILTVCPQR